jgi:iron(III) transport system substrate-binding protein
MTSAARSIAFALGCALSLLGCPSGAPPTPAAAGSGEPATEPAPEPAAAEAPAEPLVVYSGRGEALVGPLFEAFEQAHGVEVRVNYAGTSQLAATLLEEGANTPADVFFAQDVGTLGLMEREGAFAPLLPATLERVESPYRSGTGVWVGTSGRARVVAYNPTRVTAEELPTRVEDLLDPKWRGRVGWAPENASFQAFLAAKIELEGEDAARAFVTGMLANEARAYPSNTPGVIAVGAGEIDAMITNHYYLYRVLEEKGADYPVANHYFQNDRAESLVNAAGAGVLVHSDNQTLAQALVAFLVSEEAEAHFVAGNREFPTVAGIAGPEGLPTIAELRSPAIDATQVASLERAVRLLQETGAL